MKTLTTCTTSSLTCRAPRHLCHLGTVYDIPLEILDIILQKSYLHWILNSSTNHRDEDVIRSLISVDVCFYRRITKQRFKKSIWRFLKDFYGKTKKRCAIIRNNRNYLLENIQPIKQLIDSLLSLNSITEEQSHFIQRKRSARDKNDELLNVVETFDETSYLNFVNCLRETNQKTLAKITENGGVVIKIELQTLAEERTASMRREKQLHQNIKDLLNRAKPRLRITDKRLSQLKNAGIEILCSQLERQTVVAWIWCGSQTALENIQKLYDRNRLKDVLFENIQQSFSKVINIDRSQFEKTVGVRSISINYTQTIDLPGNYIARGVAKLRNEIFVLCYLSSSYSSPCLIRVFGYRHAFRFQKEIEIKEIMCSSDIATSVKENCLYISDLINKCVWKITGQTDNRHKVIKWLTTAHSSWALSVSSDGQLVMVNNTSSSLMIYGSDAEIVRTIPLPREIKNPARAVETSIGNFIIVHAENGLEDKEKEVAKKNECGEEKEPKEEKELMEEMELKDWLEVKKERQQSSLVIAIKWNISEVTRDGQMVIRSFITAYEPPQLNLLSYYISLDSDDRVFVADVNNCRMILLDSYLPCRWIRLLCPPDGGKQKAMFYTPFSLCYDEVMKQLIVVGMSGTEVNVYTLSRN